MTFNTASKFDNATIIGSVKQDLNAYKCPSCGSPFFLRGCSSYLQYTQCLKSNCERVDIIGPEIPMLKDKASAA